jgi:hypothetical protein
MDLEKWGKVMSRKIWQGDDKKEDSLEEKYNHCLAKPKHGLLERNK